VLLEVEASLVNEGLYNVEEEAIAVELLPVERLVVTAVVILVADVSLATRLPVAELTEVPPIEIEIWIL
jgi:hypothetical protein